MKENENIKMFGYDPQSHPEKLEGEKFVGNTHNPIAEHIKNCNGVRIGEQAYDIYGLPLESYLRPIFAVGSSYNTMMEKRFSNAKNGMKATYVKTYKKDCSII